MSPLSALDWVLAASVALSVLLVEEVRKLLLGLWLRKSD